MCNSKGRDMAMFGAWKTTLLNGIFFPSWARRGNNSASLIKLSQVIKTYNKLANYAHFGQCGGSRRTTRMSEQRSETWHVDLQQESSQLLQCMCGAPSSLFSWWMHFAAQSKYESGWIGIWEGARSILRQSIHCLIVDSIAMSKVTRGQWP